MTDAGPRVAAPASERTWRWWIVPALLAGSTVALVFAVLWGTYVADPPIKVFEFDAGPVEGMRIGEVRAFPELDLYMVGLASGEIRAVDGRIESNGCRVRWEPESEVARAANPLGKPGAFVDPCSDSVWAATGNHLSPSGEALRTFIETYRTLEDGRQHVFVELIGRDRPVSSVLPRSKEFVLVIEGARGGPGDRREASTFAELGNALPFKPVLPTYLPHGLLWRQALVKPATSERPTEFSASFARERPSRSAPERLRLSFGQWDVEEYTRLMPTPSASADQEPDMVVDVGGVEGRLWELKNRDPGAVGFVLHWEACGQRFVAIYESLDGTVITSDELVRVARSMVEACD